MIYKKDRAEGGGRAGHFNMCAETINTKYWYMVFFRAVASSYIHCLQE